MSQSTVKSHFGIPLTVAEADSLRPMIELEEESEDVSSISGQSSASTGSQLSLHEEDTFQCNDIYYEITDIKASRGIYTVLSTVIQCGSILGVAEPSKKRSFRAVLNLASPNNSTPIPTYTPLCTTSSTDLILPDIGDRVYWKEEDVRTLAAIRGN